MMARLNEIVCVYFGLMIQISHWHLCQTWLKTNICSDDIRHDAETSKKEILY